MSDLIYVPKGRALEYCSLAVNVYPFCEHQCAYCYCPIILHKTKEDFSRVSPRGEDFFIRLENESKRKQRAGVTGQVLLSFIGDCYGPAEEKYHHTRRTIQILHKYGFSVCVLTKGGLRATADIDLFREGDSFATTLTLYDEEASKFWEPKAATPIERMMSLVAFHEREISTWVSLEPVIDPSETIKCITRSHPYVDLYRAGKMNHFRTNVDWHQFAADITNVLYDLGKAFYIKEDLRPYLPADVKEMLVDGYYPRKDDAV